MNVKSDGLIPGQIVKTIIPLDDEKPNEVYIVTDDLSEVEATVVSLSQLQRNIKNPKLAKRATVAIANLKVVENNLEKYITSFNK